MSAPSRFAAPAITSGRPVSSAAATRSSKPRPFWKVADPIGEQPLDAGGHRQWTGKRVSARELPMRQERGEFDDGKRVATGGRGNFASNIRGNGRPSPVREQRLDRGGGQGLDAQLRQRPRLELTRASREQHRDPVGLEPPRRERESLLRVSVHPLRVIDQAEERALLGSFGEQRQHCERHAIEIRRIVVAERERASQRRRLRLRKPLQQPEYGAQQLMQRGERQLSLRFDTPRLEHRHVVHREANLVDQRRLARSRLSDQDKAAAPAGARIVQQRLQLRPALLRARRALSQSLWMS